MLDYLDAAIVNAVRQVLGGFGVIFASCEILTRLSTFASKPQRLLGFAHRSSLHSRFPRVGSFA